MLLHILLVFHIIICVLLIVTVLMQQSEGGALGMGGGPSGFMTARGAGNLLTRITWGLFSAFLVLSILLTVLAGRERAASSLSNQGIERIDPSAMQPRQQPAAPPANAPLTAPIPGSSLPTVPAPATGAAPVQPAPQQ